MKKTSYLLFFAAAGFVLSACEEKKEYFEMGTLDGIGMVVRSVSIEDGVTTRPIDAVTVDYNNLIGLNESKPATVNGATVNAYVNPENHMQLVVPVNCDWNNTYNVVIPDGFVFRSDDPSVTNEGLSLSFNTNLGLNPQSVEKNLTNSNATAEAKALYQELLDNYGKVMYSGAMGGVGWETGYTDYIRDNNGGAGYPKIVGFDYLHLAYSPSNWIDYGDITPVKSVWDAGSIPAITWHWNVPEINGNIYPFNEGDAPVEMPDNWSGSLQIPASYFATAKEGNVLTVNISDVAENAQGSFKNGSTWAGIVDENGKNYDYFEVNTYDEEGNILAYADTFTLTLTPSVLNEIKENGLIISGHDYTLQSVVFDGFIVHNDLLSFNNTFSPLKVLTPGTPFNEVAEADIAKLAGYMKLLQEANIPVLFRPFHEAAGDYTYGAWFWWGKDGVDATKQLWKYLRNKLEGEYGLNNIIWVWTMQTSNAGEMADASLVRSAYPGDDVVDIVGIDLYPDNALTDQSEQFYLINSVVGGKKMVALSEVGNLVDPNAAVYNNALWSYFMNWYDYASEGVFGFHDWNTQAVSLDGKDYSNPWAAVANNPFVVNR